jgi:hypothetical protein
MDLVIHRAIRSVFGAELASACQEIKEDFRIDPRFIVSRHIIEQILRFGLSLPNTVCQTLLVSIQCKNDAYTSARGYSAWYVTRTVQARPNLRKYVSKPDEVQRIFENLSCLDDIGLDGIRNQVYNMSGTTALVFLTCLFEKIIGE